MTSSASAADRLASLASSGTSGAVEEPLAPGPDGSCLRGAPLAGDGDECDPWRPRRLGIPSALLPALILLEAERRRAELAATVDVAALRKEIETLDGRRSRLSDSYELGGVTKPVFERKLADIIRRRDQVAHQLAPMAALPPIPDAKRLNAACAALRARLPQAPADQLALALTALKVTVTADVGLARVEGAIPSECCFSMHMALPVH